MFGLKNEEILTYFLLIVVGYTIAKMFSRRCNGFSVGGETLVSPAPKCLNNCLGTKIMESAEKIEDFYASNAQGCCDTYCSNDGFDLYRECIDYIQGKS